MKILYKNESIEDLRIINNNFRFLLDRELTDEEMNKKSKDDLILENNTYHLRALVFTGGSIQ